MAIIESHNVHDGRAGGGSALHWTVRRPDGKLVDIDGAHDPDELVDRYHGDADEDEETGEPMDEWGISTRADAWEWYGEAPGAPLPLTVAAGFVEAVLAWAEAEPDDGLAP